MKERHALPFGRSRLDRLTDVVEQAARCGDLAPKAAEAVRATALGRGRPARLAFAVSDLLEALARAHDSERQRACSAAQSLREPVTSIRAQVQVLCQIPDLTPSARAALLADMDEEVTRLSAELDALAAVLRRQPRRDQERSRDHTPAVP